MDNNPREEINLDLSLGLPLEKKDDSLVEGHGPHMQPLRSVSVPQLNIHIPLPPLPPHYMIPNAIDQYWIQPSPGLGVFQHPQAMENENVALENPRRGGRQPQGHQARKRLKKAVALAENEADREIDPPYAWATNKEAVIHNIRYLLSKNIRFISGQVECRPCKKIQTLEYNLPHKFYELTQYIKENMAEMRQRASEMWLKPKLISCSTCKSEMKPVINDNKEKINWLFLLLGQMLGCCTLKHLRYFCHKINEHQTGAKDRVLYETYVGLCKQLDPCDDFKL